MRKRFTRLLSVLAIGSLVCICIDATLQVSPLQAQDKKFLLRSFDRIQLEKRYFSGGSTIGDINRDGKMDVISGPYWYAGPDFKERFEYYPPESFDKHDYSNNLHAFVYDFNGDEWLDIFIIGKPIDNDKAMWYENPRGNAEYWKRHTTIDLLVGNESPTLRDITGDGKPEMIFIKYDGEEGEGEGEFGWAAPDWNDLTREWIFHTISAKGEYGAFTHGLGFGDVNGDGREDLLEATGWWEQPVNPSKGTFWKKHESDFGDGGAQMFAYDVDGDGDNDIVTSLQAHGYGLAWFEQIQDAREISFKKHLIMGSKPEYNRYGVRFSQLHGLFMVDVDGDGIKDIVTGKNHWAHPPAEEPGGEEDPDTHAPAVLYWFKTERTPTGVNFVPYQIDDNSGVGRQFVAGDINGDGYTDIAMGNKLGIFVFLQKVKSVSRKEWEKAQPKPINGWVGRSP